MAVVVKALEKKDCVFCKASKQNSNIIVVVAYLVAGILSKFNVMDL